MAGAYINSFISSGNLYQIGFSDGSTQYVTKSGCKLYLTENPSIANFYDSSNNLFILDLTLIYNPRVDSFTQLVGIEPTPVNIPEGDAGGDLSGEYPNPNVNWANGVSYYNTQYLKEVTESDVLDALGYIPEDEANKTDIMAGNTASSTKYLSAKGVYDWVIAQAYITASALTGYATQVWVNAQGFITNVVTALGYTPENVANKSDSYTVSSSTTYASTKAVVDGLATKQNSLGYTAENTANKSDSYTLSSSTTYATTKAVVDGLATKQASLGFTAVPNTRTISTSTPLSGGGDLSANRTLSIADASADGTTKGAAAFTASDFNATSGVISIDYTNGQAASASNKGFLTAADWSTFNNKLTATKFISTANSTAVTGTTANTLATSQLITGSTFTVGNQLLVTCRGVKTGTAGTTTMRIYVNTTSNLTGATLLATVGPTTATNLFFQIERNMFIKSATNTEMANTAANSAFDLAQIAAVSAVNIDWTTDKYIIFALQNTSTADSVVISGYRILEY